MCILRDTTFIGTKQSNATLGIVDSFNFSKVKAQAK